MTELSNLLLNLPSDTRIEGYIDDDPCLTISELINRGYKFGIDDPSLDVSTIQIVVNKSEKIFLPMIKLFAECLANGSDDIIKENITSVIIELFHVPSIFYECVNYLLTNEIIQINDLDCQIDRILKSYPKEFVTDLTNLFIENIHFPDNYLHILIRNDFIESAYIVFNYCLDNGISLPIGTLDTDEFACNIFFYPYHKSVYDYNNCVLSARKLVDIIVHNYYLYTDGDYNKMYDEMIHGLAQKRYIVNQPDLINNLLTIILDNHIKFDLDHFLYMYSAVIPNFIIDNIHSFNTKYFSSTVRYILSTYDYLDTILRVIDKIDHERVISQFVVEYESHTIILRYIDILYTYKYDFKFFEWYLLYDIHPDILKYIIDRPDIKIIREKSIKMYKIDIHILDLYHQLLLSRDLTFGDKFYLMARSAKFITYCCDNVYSYEYIDKYIRWWKNSYDNSIINSDLLILELKKILLDHEKEIIYHDNCKFCTENTSILCDAINKYFGDIL